MKRLPSLDYLRGLAALGIMVFHYSMWVFGFFTAADFLGRVGIYGVSIFYVLSGLTLYHVYYNKIKPPYKPGMADFAIKRIFRIFPLLWLVTIITILLKPGIFPLNNIILNITGLFGLVCWNDTISYGAWSIGNELVFYLFFPLFIILSQKSKILFSVLSVIILLIYLWFAFVKIDSTKTLAEYFNDYTNPLNQLFLFLGGYLIGYLLKDISVKRNLSLFALLICLLAFILLPAKGDSVMLITGFNRVYFTFICLTVCFLFYKTDFQLPRLAHRALQTLGEISYALYLIHPVIWHIVATVIHKYAVTINKWVNLGICFTVSLFTAYIIYRFYERAFMKAGSRVAEKK